MFTPHLHAALVTSPVFSLLTAQHNEVAFSVIFGLALLALVEILAGLWMVHLGNRQHGGER